MQASDLQTLPRILLEFIDSPADISSRTKAALEVASVLNMNRNQALTPSMIQKLSNLLHEDLEVDDMARLLLAKSMLFYNVRDFGSSSKCIQEALTLKAGNHGANSVVAMLQNGVGAILAAQGDYAAALDAFLKSHQTACRIESGRICLQAAGNVSLSFMRLGEYEKAIDWGQRVLSQDDTDSGLPFCFAARSSTLLAYAMRGEVGKAEALMRGTAEKITALHSQGLLQAWALYSGDAYRVMGNYLEADREAKHATTGSNTHLHMEFCAGPYARALARSAELGVNVDGARGKLDSFRAELAQYDAIDRAEILNAKCWLRSREGDTCSQDLALMHDYLKALPAAVSQQLRSMAMLDY
jgi:tetratricopeptide (TPR) repeat protein